MIAGLFFICWRIVELVCLIPPIGMLSYFVDGFVKANMLTPTYILVLFIVCVLAAVWVLDTLFRHDTAKRSALFVAFVDLCFMGALIAGVYELRGITNANCASFNEGSLYVSLGPFGYYGYQGRNPLSLSFNKTCGMLKASFAFGIMEIIFFSITAFFAALMHRHHHTVVVKETHVRRRSSHGSRRGHSSGGRHRSSSRSHYYV